MAAAKHILSRKRAEGLTKWKMWHQRKGVCAPGRHLHGTASFCVNLVAAESEKITRILQSQHYNTSSPLTKDFGINGDMEGYNLTIQDGLHVFRPSVGVLDDFENFLLRAEYIAGRETGVVKVILPKEL